MSQSPQWMATARVVRRLGFGATGSEIDAAVSMGVDAYLAAALAVDPGSDPGVTATPPPTFKAIPKLGTSALIEERTSANKARRAQVLVLTDWWLHRMVAAGQPAREKLTFFWHNHFATSATKVKDARAMLAQNEKLRSMALGGFRPLAYAMLTDAAMLAWLDGAKNVAKAPNENLAREFMELFALGHGNGYTETDVREGARALTGWRTTRAGVTGMVNATHDFGRKSVLGVTGSLDAAGFCDAVLNSPASPGYLATRMWRGLAGDTPPPASTLGRLVDAYGPDRDLRALVTAVLTDPEFASPASTMVISPVEWMVGATRALAPATTPTSRKRMATTVRALGQVPFYPPSVGGWPAGQAWLTTAAAETRWRAATTLAGHAQSSVIADAPAGDRIDAAAHLLGVGRFSDRTVKVMKTAVAQPVTLTAIALNSPEYLTA